jgi:acyl carrier protein
LGRSSKLATIFERLKRVVMERLGVDEDQVVPTASFIRDLNADSIELIELVMSIEDEFSNSSHKVVIPDEELERLATIQDVVSYLRGLGVSDD